MEPGSKPAEAALPALQELFQRSAGERFGLTAGQFEEILEQVAAKYLPSGTPPQKLKLWQELRLESSLWPAPAPAARTRHGRSFSPVIARSSMTLPAASPEKTRVPVSWPILSTPIFTAPPSARAKGFPA